MYRCMCVSMHHIIGPKNAFSVSIPAQNGRSGGPKITRFPGYLSKFLDIKFSEVPNGLSAFSKVAAGRVLTVLAINVHSITGAGHDQIII